MVVICNVDFVAFVFGLGIVSVGSTSDQALAAAALFGLLGVQCWVALMIVCHFMCLTIVLPALCVAS